MPAGSYGEPIAIGQGLGSLPELYDVDGDGDLDLVSAEYFAAKMHHSSGTSEQTRTQ